MIIFFYGLFMDDELLHGIGVNPVRVGFATVDGFRLRIGPRATLSEASNGAVEGTVRELGDEDVARLYSDPSLAGYAPIEVTAVLRDGRRIAAACYVLPESQALGPPSADYVAKLRALATKLGLTPEYVASIGREPVV